MSKIFKITGNFVQNGEWAQPDPSWAGKIVVSDHDLFFGYCDELYQEIITEANKTRFLVGAFANNGKNGQRGIAFYKLSNEPRQAPLMYVMPDLTDPNSGSWAGMMMLFGSGQFEEQGKAKVTVEEQPFSETEAQRIENQFSQVNTRINCHSQLLDQIHCCIDIITNAK